MSTISDLLAIRNVVAVREVGIATVEITVAAATNPDDWAKVGSDVYKIMPAGIVTRYRVANYVELVRHMRHLQSRPERVSSEHCLDETAVDWDRAERDNLRLRGISLSFVDATGEAFRWEMHVDI